MRTYIVEKTLEGKASEIKETVIATEIYGRSADYDPKTDSIVRVEATRLRAKLQSYYRQEGQGDVVRITIPKGSYIPCFERTAPSTSALSVPRKGLQRKSVQNLCHPPPADLLHDPLRFELSY
jgi:hypothetical protein